MVKNNKALSNKETSSLNLEKISFNATHWIGSIHSLVVHTIIFLGVLSLSLFGFNFDRILLILTTLLSFEAIYLAIFIQMTVNRNTAQLQGVGEDIEEISEDIEEIQEDVEEISEDIEEIQEDVEEIQEDEDDEGAVEKKEHRDAIQKIKKLEKSLALLLKEIADLKKK